MKVFEFTVKDSDGIKRSGTVKVRSKEELERRLKLQGFTVEPDSVKRAVMQSFAYEAVNHGGTKQVGVIKAFNEEEVEQKLKWRMLKVNPGSITPVAPESFSSILTSRLLFWKKR